ncbi:MAG: phosphotransferase family protein [Acidimicrobiales bacterium]
MGTEPTAKLGGAAELSTDKITTSTRDPEELGRRIGAWMATVLPPGADPEVGGVVTPEGNGMSSETILFDAAWTVDGERRQERCVARIEPEMDKVPVFPSYELAQQFDVMSLVAEATSVPIPETLWYEGDRSFIGAPFFVMARIDGIVPPDVLPYTFGDCWVDAATPEQRATLQDSAVRALAGVHTVTTETHDLSALQYDRPGETALERHLAWWEGYHEWVVGDRRSPLLDECFAWLRAHLPADVGPDSLSWGDARIGNMMFADFECVAVLDWEMAGVAPPEVDLGWMAYLHLFFQDLATDLGVAGLPDFMRHQDLAATYGALTGRPVGDLRWHLAYAAMRHGVIMRRVTERAVLFGEAVEPADLDEMIIHRATLRAMLDGSYWDRIG